MQEDNKQGIYSTWLRGIPVGEAETKENIEADFWAVWQAASPMFPARLTRPFLHGMTGGALRSASCLLSYSDITCWLIPGLIWCGLRAELLPMPIEESECLHFLHTHLHSQHSLPIFAFASLEGKDNQSNALPMVPAFPPTHAIKSSRIRRRQNPEQDILELPPADTAIQRQALVTALNADNADTPLLILMTHEGIERAIHLEELSKHYTHALCLQSASLRCARMVYSGAAVRQWAVFACAFPDRILRTDSGDAFIRQLAAKFWRELAGKSRSAQATRLHHLANTLESATQPEDINTFTTRIFTIAVESFDLSREVANALLAPPDYILTDAKRRELIYLCRAGTRDLKILAAHRLNHEREYPDAQSALQQLRYDGDAWVRKAGSSE